MAKKQDEWDRIHYPELTDAENDEIRQARRLGFAKFWPAIPSGEAQSQNTLAGAKQFLAWRADDEDPEQFERLRQPGFGIVPGVYE